MQKRPPTVDEVRQRAEGAAIWLGLLLYVVIGFGGLELFQLVVKDRQIIDAFIMVWWLPSGVAAWFLKTAATSWLFTWVPSKPPSRL